MNAISNAGLRVVDSLKYLCLQQNIIVLHHMMVAVGAMFLDKLNTKNNK